jgi:hypothetical protein
VVTGLGNKLFATRVHRRAAPARPQKTGSARSMGGTAGAYSTDLLYAGACGARKLGFAS